MCEVEITLVKDFQKYYQPTHPGHLSYISVSNKQGQLHLLEN